MGILNYFKRKNNLIPQDFMTLQGNNTVRKHLTLESGPSQQQKLNKNTFRSKSLFTSYLLRGEFPQGYLTILRIFS